ncbi:hypothetical protein RF11_07315 [Thelohanellus kitauei]|uniref:Complement component 1 Q subcomponent-binding protein, mitochondrial n=1 Tax=Thelohanellus kitauei TaxID=669202 RepID=A0A0C2JEN7_THEKT|nr:hypothetical protein RF11_07315 [Thelohanellus kitauei]
MLVGRALSTFVRRSLFLTPLLRASPRFMSTDVARKLSKTEIRDKTKGLLADLDHELEAEEANFREVGPPEGWTLGTRDACVTLTRHHENEKIVVVFDPFKSNKVSYRDLGGCEQEEDTPDFACVPSSVVVEVSREGKGCIGFDLRINDDGDDDFGDREFDDDVDVEEEEYNPQDEPVKFDDIDSTSIKLGEDVYAEMSSISFIDKDGKPVYKFDDIAFDDKFAENMVFFLKVRGVDAEFLRSVCEFCTSYESKAYSNYIRHLKAFISN